MSASQEAVVARTAGEQLATFWVDRLWLGLDVLRVQEVVRAHDLTPVPHAPPGIAGLFNLRGRVVTAVDVRVCLGLPPRELASAVVHLIVETPEGAVSLMADREGDVVDLAQEDREEVPSTIGSSLRPFLATVGRVDRDLLLVLDLDLLLLGASRSDR